MGKQENDMGNHLEQILDIPIDPQGMQECWNVYDWVDDEKPTNRNVITYKASFPSEVFLAIEQIGNLLHEGTKWNKKARIILEYDPQAQKMTVASIMEQDEAIHLERIARWQKAQEKEGQAND